MRPLDVSDEGKRILDAVRSRPTEGYALRSLTGLEPTTLVKTLQDLRDSRLVEVRGTVTERSIDDLLVWVPPTALGKVAFILGQEPR